MTRGSAGVNLLLGACCACILLSGCGSGGDNSGEASAAGANAALERVEQDALQKYHWYLEAKAGLLVDWTDQLWGQIVAGEAGKAESRYTTARVQYGQLLPIASRFKALDLRINGLPGEELPGEFQGFHRIEAPLFRRESTAGLKPVAKALSEDVGKLHHAIKLVELDPRMIAESTQGLLKELSTTKVEGKEEPYSQIGMVDVSAATEGAERAFEAIRPLLIASDPELVGKIEAQFVTAYAALDTTGTPGRQPQIREPAAGAMFRPYEELSSTEVQNVAKPLIALTKLFSEVPEQLPES
jgi:iron uptake system component EfeO